MGILRRGKFWIVLAILFTLQAGIVYIAVQQSLRVATNQPQRSMANDVAYSLSQGKNPHDLVQGYIDMAHNTAPFIIIYDQYGKAIAGNGYLDDQTPQVPIGVLSATKNHKINSVTWEPRSGVRIASVSVQGGDKYVLGGRSLQDTEHQIKWFGQWVIALWAIALLLIAAGYQLTRRKTSHKHAPTTDKAD